MKLKIEIMMDNAAFQEADDGAEAARILSELAEDIGNGTMGISPGASMQLRDINGNRVGEAKVTR